MLALLYFGLIFAIQFLLRGIINQNNDVAINEIDLKKLQEELIGVVQETMQPAHVSLWLSKPEDKSL